MRELNHKVVRSIGTVFTILLVLLLTACGQNQTESLQEGPLNVNNPGQFETTEEGNVPIEQNTTPLSTEQSNQNQDKQTIKEAAEEVPGTEVTSVTFDGKKVRVTVRVEEDLNSDERIAWSNNIKSAIKGATNQYNVQVIVN
ncbi:hypothetical protein NC797_11085 [Aquibacillus sp. 3ASR75-11]|uniref:Uncharacterized protein n=1 Tax=Terrihalobacillus insolitus TaxID=2950438 RepID=A0A9X4AMQ0_9BACI|nr:hypothetical protein [Terrihalobacillus insolitus]MDC3411774.1 hypothetical protein [Terrihalobacillus insolitus]MDC3425049.1 hypothetical protein [Terrihalobacillus insolitus]